MSTILVTGSAGLVGTHLAEALLARGEHVIGFDNHISGSVSNTRWLMRKPGFRHLEGDVCDAATLFTVGRFDAVLHFACPASPADFDRIPIEILRAGSIGTLNVADLAARYDARMLLASTSEIYGEPLAHPQTEQSWGNVNPIGPRACYEEAKRFSEAVVSSHRRTLGLDAAIVRIFNTYGPRIRPDDGRVVSNLIMQALAGQPLTIQGDGAQTRSFCFVDDLVVGIIAMLDSDLHGPVNLGNPDEITIRELADTILDLCGSGSPVEYLPLPEDDPTRRRPDISLARAALGWNPEVDLRTGLARVVSYLMATGHEAGASPELPTLGLARPVDHDRALGVTLRS